VRGLNDNYVRLIFRGWMPVLVALLMFESMQVSEPVPRVQLAATTVSEPVAQDVTFYGEGGLALHGTVLSPAGAGRRWPALVMVAGSGPGSRNDHRGEAMAFARSGIVTLVYDKRTVGYSIFHRDYSVLASDALAGLAVLRARRDVDPALTGMWALSEGTWVAEIAAAREPTVAFLALVGASGPGPARETSWEDQGQLRHNGAPESLANTISVTGLRVLINAGLFAEANFEPTRYLTRIHQPVLAMWGEKDRSSPPRESSEILQRALAGPTTIRFFPGAQHDLLRSPDGYAKLPSFADGYPNLVATWVNGLAAGAPTSSAQQPPRQERSSIALQPTASYESAPAQLAMLALLLLAFASYPILAIARPRYHHNTARWPARTLAAAGVWPCWASPRTSCSPWSA